MSHMFTCTHTYIYNAKFSTLVKKPISVVLLKNCSENFCKCHRKTPAMIYTCDFLKNGLHRKLFAKGHHSCSLMKDLEKSPSHIYRFMMRAIESKSNKSCLTSVNSLYQNNELKND